MESRHDSLAQIKADGFDNKLSQALLTEDYVIILKSGNTREAMRPNQANIPALFTIEIFISE